MGIGISNLNGPFLDEIKDKWCANENLKLIFSGLEDGSLLPADKLQKESKLLIALNTLKEHDIIKGDEDLKKIVEDTAIQFEDRIVGDVLSSTLAILSGLTLFKSEGCQR